MYEEKEIAVESLSKHNFICVQKATCFGYILFDIDIFVNCNWVDTRWQYTFTHKQYVEHHN
jgi:hypothetical protein